VSVVLPEVIIVVFALAPPAVPVFVTPVVYSADPELFDVIENWRV